MTNAGNVDVTVTLGLQKLLSDAKQAQKVLEAQIQDIEVQVKAAGVDTVEKEFKAASDAIDKAAKSGKNFDAFLQGIAQGVGQKALDLLVNSLQSAVGALQNLVGEALGAAQQFDSATAALNTLGVDGAAVANSLKGLSKELNYQASAVELNQAAYDVFSSRTATLVEGLTDSQAATEILTASVIAAKGGFTDTGTVADALTSVLNSYGLSAANASAFTDKFAATVNAGKVTIEQYASQIGRVAPIAAQAGVSIDELNGFIATATVQGVPVESTFAGIRQAISSVLKPTVEAQEVAKSLGIQFDAAALKTMGLSGVLAQLSSRGLDTQDNLFKLFGSVEAVTAIAPSTGKNFQVLQANIDASANSAGLAQKSFEAVAGSLENRLAAAQGVATAAILEFGQTIQPVQAALIGVFGEVLSKAVEGSNALDILSGAAERLTQAIQENPELVDRLAEGLTRLADILAQVVADGLDAFSAAISDPDNIQALAEGIDTAIDGLQALINLFKGAAAVIEFVANTPGLKQLLGFSTDLTKGFYNAVNAAATLGDKLNAFGNQVKELPLVKQLQTAIDAAKLLLEQLNKVPGLGAVIPDLPATPTPAPVPRESDAQAFDRAQQAFTAGRTPTSAPATTPAPSPQPAPTPAPETAPPDYDAQLQQLESAYQERQIVLANANQGEETLRQQSLQAEQKYLNDRVAVNQSKLAQLKTALAGAADPEEQKKLQEQILQTEQAIQGDRLSIAQNGAKAREQAEQAAAERQKKILDDVARANAQAQAAIEQSQTTRITAVKQAEADGVLSAEDAAQQIATIQQQTTADTIAQKQRELAEVARLRQQGILSAEEAADREMQLSGEVGQLNLQRIEQEIAAQEQLKQAAIDAIEEQAQLQKGALQNQSASLDLKAGSTQGQLDLLNAQVSLSESLGQLEQERLNTKIAAAEASGNEQAVERLKVQQLQLQSRQIEKQFQAKKQELKLQQELRRIELDRQRLSVEQGVIEAQKAILIAQKEGASQEELDLLQKALDLSQKQVDAVDDSIARQDELNRLEEENLNTQQQINRERQRQAQYQEQASRRQNPESDSGEQTEQPTNSNTTVREEGGIRYLSHSTRTSPEPTFDPATQYRGADGRIMDRRINAAGSAFELGSGSQLSSRSLLDGAIPSDSPLRSSGLSAATQANDPAAIAQTIASGNQLIVGRLDKLEVAIIQLANSPRSLSLSTPDPMKDLGEVMSELSKQKLKGARV